MKVCVSGASGLVGSALTKELEQWGYDVVHLVRNPSQAGTDCALCDYKNNRFDAELVDGAEAVIHLAGENVGNGRWTAAKKKRILESRVLGTRFLSEKLAQLKNPPRTFVCASAVGFYGDRGEKLCEESTPQGEGFLADVVKQWEDACAPLVAAGVRVVNLRIGVVLSKDGGALNKMLLPFKMGIGGKVGSGEQYMSWIWLGDLVGVIHHVLNTPSLKGAVNAVAPNPVTNLEFTKVLGSALHRPTVFPLPAFVARLLFGEMADELLLASTRVSSQKLEQSGYVFQAPTIESALTLAL